MAFFLGFLGISASLKDSTRSALLDLIHELMLLSGSSDSGAGFGVCGRALRAEGPISGWFERVAEEN